LARAAGSSDRTGAGSPVLKENGVIRELDGKMPRIHPTAFVSEAAYVVGDVEIGAGSSVWPGTVIRADAGIIKIGSNTCIQDGSVVHADDDAFIGDNVVIGHKVLCHAGKVGDWSLIGNGASVNDGADIGEGSLVASGAVVIERMSIPPGSLVVGVPARVRGSLQERHRDLIRMTVEEYIHKGARFKSNGL
jgi:carbonic anhydrase/acetyltransferase-like protein (isoleucine patch superfamily)